MARSLSCVSRWRARIHDLRTASNDDQPLTDCRIVSRIGRSFVWIGAGAFAVALLRPAIGDVDGFSVHLGPDLLSAAVAFVLVAFIRAVIEARASAVPVLNVERSELAAALSDDAPPMLHSLHMLSEREREVLQLLAVPSFSIKEIAQQLNLSPNTIRTHERNIGEKLGVQRRWPIVDAARQQGLLDNRVTRIEHHQPD